MLVTEYRIPLPLTVDEYKIGQLFTTLEMSKRETGGGEGVEVLYNESFSDQFSNGQYTYKIYHLAKKLPPFIRNIAPQGAVQLHEESWNSYPLCRTKFNKCNFTDAGFSITIQTQHFNDKGEQDNVHELPNDLLKKRNIVYIDIVNDTVSEKFEYDPKKFKSVKTGRGPFTNNWIETVQPIMTCYKLVTTDFKLYGLQTKIEKLIQSTEKTLLLIFHKMLICSMDKWYNLTLEEMRKIEQEGAVELHYQRSRGDVKGMVISE